MRLLILLLIAGITSAQGTGDLPVTLDLTNCTYCNTSTTTTIATTTTTLDEDPGRLMHIPFSIITFPTPEQGGGVIIIGTQIPQTTINTLIALPLIGVLILAILKLATKKKPEEELITEIEIEEEKPSIISRILAWLRNRKKTDAELRGN